MLQQGLNIADVAYFIGEDAPKMTGIVDPELPKGYQFDYINAEVIERDLFVKDGLLTLPHGTQYRILVLPKLETMRPELLAKIKKLIEDGAVVLGPAPKRSPSGESFPTADRQVEGCQKRKGRIAVRYDNGGGLEAYRLCAGLRIAGRCSGSLWTSFCRRCRYLFYLQPERRDD